MELDVLPEVADDAPPTVTMETDVKITVWVCVCVTTETDPSGTFEDSAASTVDAAENRESSEDIGPLFEEFVWLLQKERNEANSGSVYVVRDTLVLLLFSITHV
jgi:alpha-L-fucosidase